jgi:diphthamide biosynthesis protein 2
MATPALASAPVLSTPDTHIFEDPTPAADVSSLPRLSDEQVALTYEIERTVKEIKEGRWKRIALQFPDHMLGDAPRVYERLGRGLKGAKTVEGKSVEGSVEEDINAKLAGVAISEDKGGEEKLFILGDTSYGACCVDEVAAEHVDADVVVHYGRSCLSPPSRLPVIYVFTARPLELDPLVATFKETYPDKDAKVVLMADIPFAHHISALATRLQDDGYTHIHATAIVHDPAYQRRRRTSRTCCASTRSSTSRTRRPRCSSRSPRASLRSTSTPPLPLPRPPPPSPPPAVPPCHYAGATRS